MGKKGKPKNDKGKAKATEGTFIRLETTVIIALIALVMGFFGGEIIDLSKPDSQTGQTGSVQPPPSVQQSTQMPAQASIQNSKILELEKQVASEPGNIEAWTQLGNLYFDGNQIKQAIKAYKKSLGLSPYNPNVWTDLGVMYRRNKQPVEALGAFNKAIEIDPRHEQSRMNKGIVLMHDMEDVNAAIVALEELLKVNPLAKASNGKLISEFVERLKKDQKSAATQSKP